ncbi:MAG: type VI secretion system baseplate subunit TssG, partial [Burkholderiales bacterium]|nr:type VI secretion system baseplate subunit TssG [Burkholderiales bacterium]
MSAKPLPGKDAARRAELDALFAQLESEPWAFDFFALMRRIDALVPGAPRLGRAQLPSQEPLRLGQVPELDFAPAALASFDASSQKAPRLGVRFFGLLGPQGPMPLHLTEYVRERSRQRGDPTAARFLDLFHHRLLTLFYRAWAQHQPVVQADRPADDRYAAWLGAEQGIAPDMPSRSVLPDTALLYQTGLIASRSKHPEALSKVLRQYFGIPVAVQMHMPHWLMLAAEDRSQLGHARNRPERRAGAA